MKQAIPFEARVINALAKCDRPRNSGNHDKCSRARQQEHGRMMNHKKAADAEQS